ncbi:MAG: type VI secretion system baseplate subunit TssK [Proteobacteria bacterium]|uniref:Type VI secretion system baseplate subunit TssK n=1 Tax=Candidatus Avisuccinivibrio stercorigallinarum TaxID=2840704 RepID=A0A9D9DAU3_9GAMM|nr:type VI secretion system baseplate subunit TssK [Candidatus Avisuccinivibrio stercorigallinarum]
MRFQEALHWAEGQFLQPHHFQELDRINFLNADAERSLYLSFKEGLIELAIDHDALRARRVAVTALSAILSDGLEVSLPGNLELEPLTLQLDEGLGDRSFLVYLAVPFYSLQNPNLTEERGQLRRYALHEQQRVDANSGDNEVTIVKHRYCGRLITDVRQGSGCALLPVCRLNWRSFSGGAPVLELDDKYVPPFVVLPGDNPLFVLTGQLVYELKASRDKLIGDLELTGFDPKMPSGADLLSLMRLFSLNQAIQGLSSILIPGRVQPFVLYQKLSALLAALLSFAPERDQNCIPPYDHFNLYGVFNTLVMNIRAFLSERGQASYIEIAFVKSSAHTLKAELSEEHFIKGRDYYLCLEPGTLPANGAQLIEEGDKLRVLDIKSQDSRVRGLKLSHLRFPPRFLPPQGGSVLWFKINRGESARMWRYIVEDKALLIDYAAEIFGALKARLFVSIVEDEKV